MKRIALAALSAVFMVACSPTVERHSAVFYDYFDTVTEFTAYTTTDEEFEMLSDALEEELSRLDGIFDIYSGEGVADGAKALNNTAGGGYIEVAPELYGVLKSAAEWYEESEGKLNVAMGSVLTLWHDCREEEVLPDYDELSRRAEHCDIDGIVFGDAYKIMLVDPMMSVDLGAVAKGYAGEVAAKKLIDLGAESFAISLGGNLVTHGEKPSGKWSIGVENPDGGLLTVVNVSDKAVVTSGDYQRYYEVDGVRYHHIIDPDTLYPATLWRSVTVISDSSADADALSTALFCLNLEDGKELLSNHGGEALWVSADGEIFRSEGFSDYEE